MTKNSNQGGGSCLKPGRSYQTADRAASVSAYVGLISAVHNTGADTWQKQALYHMPGIYSVVRNSR